MKLNVLACCLSLLGTAAFAQKNEWRDPNVNEIKELPCTPTISRTKTKTVH